MKISVNINTKMFILFSPLESFILISLETLVVSKDPDQLNEHLGNNKHQLIINYTFESTSYFISVLFHKENRKFIPYFVNKI